MKRLALGLTMLLSACVQAQDAPAAPDKPGNLPAPVLELQKQGLRIEDTLPAPTGFRGYVARFQGRAIPIYVPPGGQYAMIGTLIDANGNDLTEKPLAAHAVPVLDAATWDMLDKSTWVAEGAKSSDHVVYVFTDTECPYCHKLWQAIEGRIAKNGVQVRNVMVAVISQNSPGRAAAVLEAKDPEAVLRQHEESFGASTLETVKKISPETLGKLSANNALMEALGISGTPAVIYKAADGKIRMLGGLPPSEKIDEVFGAP